MNKVLVLIFFISFNAKGSESITPKQFQKLWDTGNKFRLMKSQANLLNPYSNEYSDKDLKLSYSETYEDFKFHSEEAIGSDNDHTGVISGLKLSYMANITLLIWVYLN